MDSALDAPVAETAAETAESWLILFYIDQLDSHGKRHALAMLKSLARLCAKPEHPAPKTPEEAREQLGWNLIPENGVTR